MLTSFDTETNGVDFWQGSRPFMVQLSTQPTEQEPVTTDIWQWEVDPYTRQVQSVKADVVEIRDVIQDGEGPLVAHNIGFDCHALDFIAKDHRLRIKWPWHRMHDTMSSAHLLASSEPKNLTDQVAKYLGIDVDPLDKAVEHATTRVRSILRRKSFIESYGRWLYTKAGEPWCPSAGKKDWKGDMWMVDELLRRVESGEIDAEWLRLPTRNAPWKPGDNVWDHPWHAPLREYAQADPEVTLGLYREHQRHIARLGLGKLYEARRPIARLSYDLERNGLTLNENRTKELIKEYGREVKAIHTRCLKLARNPELTKLPVNGISNALKDVVFGQFRLKAHKHTKTGSPYCMDKEVIGRWLDELPPQSRAAKFLEGLIQYRQRQTALSYMKGYNRYWDTDRKAKRVSTGTGTSPWKRIHPNLNPFGTRTLRWSSSNPNEQNISKKQGFNLRYCFGPSPGRGWAALDYENLELRLPAYSSGEASLIELFEHPDKAPYYGSNHLLNFETVYPDLWGIALNESGSLELVAEWIKSHWKASWYQRCKNGGFAVQYGSVDNDKPDKLSTADRSFGRKGCHALLKERFSALNELNELCIAQANETGYVDTMPDHSVDPDKGYPLQCERNEYGDISPTQPLNTHVQGTATWVIGRAMERVDAYLTGFNTKHRLGRQGAYIAAQVHDELVIDFPLECPYRTLATGVKRSMESVGYDVRVPLKVGCDWHFGNWSD